jgi:hypothetical protein
MRAESSPKHRQVRRRLDVPLLVLVVTGTDMGVIYTALRYVLMCGAPITCRLYGTQTSATHPSAGESAAVGRAVAGVAGERRRYECSVYDDQKCIGFVIILPVGPPVCWRVDGGWMCRCRCC